MEILLAKSAGFCFGVTRAIKLASETASEAARISSLGPIIHSPQLVAKLAEQGVDIVDTVEEIDTTAVIIRSHGASADEVERIRKRGLDIVDATCPFVKKAQEDAALLSREGYTVVVVGEAEHPEVQGIVSYAAAGQVHVVANRQQAGALPRLARVGIVAQTTQSLQNLQQVAAACLPRCSELRVFNTICDATKVRQDEAREIAGQVDLMLVIGGFNSANTTRLARICHEIQPRTFHIETAEQVEGSWLDGVDRVGVTAGASTPRWLIEEVIARVNLLTK
ncbi:MAG: 4-hydroxy-3-methylbut-2-enyl diphosphate reductase [Desulfuromonadales bacterium]|nr:4-hydroxy-3-methylbut-2-enyl diphosphate reductase [Desulfuromonadales bacterium]